MGKTIEFLKLIALSVFCLGTPVALWIGVHLASGRVVSYPNVTYAEWVSIVLTAATVVLATLAIIVAVLAVWGYKGIKDEAGQIAAGTVNKAVTALLAEDQLTAKIQDKINLEVERRTSEIAENLRRSLEYSFAYQQSSNIVEAEAAREEAQENAIREYPRDDDEPFLG